MTETQIIELEVKMRGITSISFLLLAPLGALAAPTASSNNVIPSRVLEPRAVVTPAPCQPQLNPPPTEQKSAERFEKFAHAFLETKNLSEAFEYIDATYIVRPSFIALLSSSTAVSLRLC